jgi:uncharacterized protein DUF4245
VASDSPEPDPAPAVPARARTTTRDLIGSLVVLLVLIGLVVVLTRGCEFSPSGPTVDPNTVPSVDATRELTSAGRRVDFPIRVPALPADWRSNSMNTVPVGAGSEATVAVRVGWITPGEGYLRLSQSKAPVEPLVVTEAGGGITPQNRGTVDVGGRQWKVFPGKGTEVAWVLALDEVTLLITGNASEPDFRTLATAVQSTQPVPRG